MPGKTLRVWLRSKNRQQPLSKDKSRLLSLKLMRFAISWGLIPSNVLSLGMLLKNYRQKCQINNTGNRLRQLLKHAMRITLLPWNAAFMKIKRALSPYPPVMASLFSSFLHCTIASKAVRTSGLSSMVWIVA